jgi:hypothetical protein
MVVFRQAGVHEGNSQLENPIRGASPPVAPQTFVHSERAVER